MKIPEPMNTVSAMIDRHHENLPREERGHMGVSQIGHPCDRFLWLKYRHAITEILEGRILRLFRRGQKEEDLVVSDLVAIGLKVEDRQRRVDFGGGVSGSIDGIVIGVPEAPEKPHLLEIKTHNKKSFDDLERNGVEKSKHEHFVQMQCYMLGLGLDRALYFSVCKDDDRIYTERVRLDKDFAQKHVDRAIRIAKSERLPPPIGTNPAIPPCVWCPAADFCYVTKKTEKVNCRTCAHVTPENGDFFCSIGKTGNPCRSHVLHPDMVPWKLVIEKSVGNSAFYEGKGLNGEDGKSSEEILGT